MTPASLSYYVLMVGAAVLCALAAILSLRLLLKVQGWSRTTAEVLESTVEPVTDPESNARVFRGVYLLRYRAARDIREALVRSTAVSPNREEVAARVAAHPKGTKIGIHYLTHAPGQVDPSLPVGLRHHLPSVGLVLIALSLVVLALTVNFVSQPVEW